MVTTSFTERQHLLSLFLFILLSIMFVFVHSSSSSSSSSLYDVEDFVEKTISATSLNDNDGRTTSDQHRLLKKDSENVTMMVANDNSLYVESKSTLYDGYQQAWRMLGFFVECSSSSNNNNNNNNNKNNNNKNNNNNNAAGACTRYLLWAAYVDPEYSGGGLTEYSFYDPINNTYDSSSSCDLSNNNNNGGTEKRCVPLDCHETNSTTWKLLGIYKEQYYGSEYFEQLFKHEGYCIWSYNQYSFMSEYYDAWPEGCTQSNYQTDTGTALYFDLKPSYGGYMAYAFYTDNICKTELIDETGEYTSSLQSALAKKEYLYGSTLETWNSNLNTYKYCQPCIAYSLYNSNQNNNNNRKDRILGNNNNNNNYFTCDDYAGYTNVNQCMKYRTKTTMEYATIQNIQDAHKQGGIIAININGHIYGTPYLDSISLDGIYQDNPIKNNVIQTKAAVNAYFSSTSEGSTTDKLALLILILSILIFVGGIIFLIGTIRWKMKHNISRMKHNNAMMEESLIDNNKEYIDIALEKIKKLPHEKGIFT